MRFSFTNLIKDLNRRGNALVVVSVLAFVGMTLTTSLWSYVNSLTIMNLKTKHAITIRALMNSAVDYTINGVRNRWCFTSSWTVNSSCLLTDINNVERLLLSDEALRTIEAGMPAIDYGGNISNVRIKSINSTLTFANIVPGHPLYYAVTGFKNMDQDFIMHFSITRIDDGLAKGKEVTLQVKVDLDTVSPILNLQSNIVTVVSTIMVFPREISTNALMIANDLYLDRPAPGLNQANPGDVYIPPSVNGTDSGIHFASPVFVNGNIFIPTEDAPGFTSVTFADKVIVGGGSILQQRGNTGGFSAPLSSGSLNDRYYSQSKVFGGFLNGVIFDPEADAGLKVFAGIQNVTPPNYNNVNLCLRRNNARVDLSLTRDTQLFIKYDSVNSSESVATTGSNINSTYTFLADLGSLDNFYAQGNVGAVNQRSVYSPGELNPSLTYNAPSVEDQRPIMRAQISLNGWSQRPAASVSVDLARNSILKIPMNPSDSTAEIVITTTPVVLGGHVQPQSVKIKVELIKQEKFNIIPYAVTLNGSNVTTSLEGSIDIKIQAFDVAYITDNVNIKSNRVKGGPGDTLSSEECPVQSNGYRNDIYVSGGTTYRCYSKFAWHPVMKKYKQNGFSFARPSGGTDRRFLLKRDSTAPGLNGYFTCANMDSSCVVYDSTTAPLNMDLVAFDAECNSPPTGTAMFPSFAAANWSSTSFLTQTFRSWGFTEEGVAPNFGVNPGTLLIDDTTSLFNSNTKPTFVVSSIYETCRIRKTANFVVGFFACRNLIFEDGRVSPLRIIGTFIVGKMSVPPTVISQGVRWSNIYHPSAVYELRAAGILSTGSNDSCDSPEVPLWHPYPSVARASYLFKCNPGSLRSKADPFKWTLMDPDCGLLGAQQKCKNRVLRYQIVELRRQEYL
ncbi:MAG: hypothetical protein K1X29_08855 [Bdellovibrionales bacterium]|nr:hypothetical protein [Bdellovibrionales bacterium]